MIGKLFRAIALWLLLLLPLAVHAEGIVVKSAELANTEEGALLNAQIEANLGATVEDALKKGVPIYFQLEFELTRPRYSWFTYWFSETVATSQRYYKLSYNALLRQYQVGIESPSTAPADGVIRGIGQNFSSLPQALSYMGHVHAWQVAERIISKKPLAHEATLRMKLDVSLLPKPLQVNAIASKSWSLESEVFRWTVTP